MSVDGSWKLVVDTPMGKQPGTLDLKTDGGAVSGTSTSMGNTYQIENGKIDGDALTFQVNAKQPMPMTITFNLTVAGDSLDGEVQAGPFGKSKATGTRL